MAGNRRKDPVLTGQLRVSGGRKLQSPAGKGTRPTTSRVREAVINLLAPRLQNSHWLDLCSGSGVMGCEALLNGARRVVAVENNSKTASICKANLMTIASANSQQTDVEVIRHDLLTWLKKGWHSTHFKHPWPETQQGFNLVYFDPPYASMLYEPVLKALLEGDWLQEHALVICEHAGDSPLETPPEWIEQDRRLYGSSALLLISPREHYCVGTDSKQQQTNQAGLQE